MRKIIFLFLSLMVFVSGIVTAAPIDTTPIIVKSYGHAAFQLNHGDTSIIFDPYLTGNPNNIATPEEIKTNYILVSHAHSDHLGDTFTIAKRSDATVISTFEVANLASEQGCKTYPQHIGGKANFDFGYVRITPAQHGAGVAGGEACGFIVNFYGKTIYFAGDTGIFGDMALLGTLEDIDYAFLPIGDNFTMGPKDAALAAGMLKAKKVIPMHYNTWPVIKQSAEDFKRDVEKRYNNIHVITLQPGQSTTL